MESNHHEEDSSEEVDQPEQDNTDEGIGRYYECVFCKRGFTTAQALGGHMNIHRKDRAKNRPSISVNSHKHEENYNGPRFYQPISSFPPRYYEAQEAQTMHYRTYFPASTSSARPLLYENYHHNNSHSFDQIPLRSIPFGEDWRMSLSLQFGAAHAEDHMEKKRRGRNEEDELDLELRLGHDP